MPHSATETLARQLGWLVHAPALLRCSPFLDVSILLQHELQADPALLRAERPNDYTFTPRHGV